MVLLSRMRGPREQTCWELDVLGQIDTALYIASGYLMDVLLCLQALRVRVGRCTTHISRQVSTKRTAMARLTTALQCSGATRPQVILTALPAGSLFRRAQERPRSTAAASLFWRTRHLRAALARVSPQAPITAAGCQKRRLWRETTACVTASRQVPVMAAGFLIRRLWRETTARVTATAPRPRRLPGNKERRWTARSSSEGAATALCSSLPLR
jgi:hypothetical protein